MVSTVFNLNSKDHLNCKLFLDEKGNPSLQRYEVVKYPLLEEFNDKLLSFFWRPEEIDLAKDKLEFEKLTESQKHIFTSNLKRQTLLDSVNGRGPDLALLSISSLPELEAFIILWSQNETLHSKAYTHIIRSIYPDPTIIFDEIFELQEILDCARDISLYYDRLICYNTLYSLKQQGLKVINKEYSEYEHKKAIWLALNSINALEGLRFFVSFACSFSFAENKTMEGNAKIIRLICKDEGIHLAFTQYLLNTLTKDDSDYIKIREECSSEVINIFREVIQQEKEWAKYLFKDGSMLGLNESILSQYIDWIGGQRMEILGLKLFDNIPKTNPLPWMNEWIDSSMVQVAPQETELTSYLISSVVQDIDKKAIKDLEL